MNWIDYHKYTPHNRFSTPNDEVASVTFIFVGHLTTNKGPDVLLRASKILKQNGIRFRVVICGQGPLYHDLEQDIQTFDLASEVELRGWITGELLISALWDAQVFVLPTHSEGMPNALLEAMAAGLPVISTRVSSIPEIVDVGVNGLLVQPGNAEELANAMQQMASSAKTRKIMGSNNLTYVRERHSIENAWQVVADLL
jgi:glycosyltransferase involved in cell wall biosynthesis